MKINIQTITVSAVSLLISQVAFGRINQLRIVNDTSKAIYIHLGGYATSKKIAPSKWKIFTYPFKVIPPGQSNKVKSSLVVATAGGHWQTTPNGVTSLKKPDMSLCLDYGSPKLLKKTGNRKWTIKQEGGFDKGCSVKSYHQTWYQANS
ncbi:MAG: hypothetical protein COB66_08885 [Coxiella sp. (in: Bacteria)]|nr:MAG: hypothetical protein COB66_08885 [Coxiella sp. (in: g-proteobacteria)]